MSNLRLFEHNPREQMERGARRHPMLEEGVSVEMEPAKMLADRTGSQLAAVSICKTRHGLQLVVVQ